MMIREIFLRKKISAAAVAGITALVFLCGTVFAQGEISPEKKLKLTPQDRVLILAPHPDDEVIGCGGIIQKSVDMKLPLKIVFLTYGDNNQWSFLLYRKHPVLMPKSVRLMGQVRHGEAENAAKILSVAPEQLVFLGYPDFRTLNIWYSHWGKSSSARSMFTKVTAVPYDNAYRPGALYKGGEILKDITDIIRDFKPTKIFVSHPADHNPDHRSLYLFTRVALWDLKKETDPEIYPYLVHFKKWPKPYGLHPAAPLNPPDFLADKNSWSVLPLTENETGLKLAALKEHRSQYKSSRKYLLSFIRANELFGDFPPVELKPEKNEVSLLPPDGTSEEEMPEELLDEERAQFVGIEEEFLGMNKSCLVFTLKLSRPLGKEAGVSLYLFGYKKDVPFAQMPKIHVKFGMIEHKVFDQNKKLPLDAIEVDRKAKKITIRVPLELLGTPDYILTSARTYTGAVPLDWIAWRVLEL